MNILAFQFHISIRESSYIPVIVDMNPQRNDIKVMMGNFYTIANFYSKMVKRSWNSTE